jgi:hypothetical protein
MSEKIRHKGSIQRIKGFFEIEETIKRYRKYDKKVFEDYGYNKIR